MKTELTDGETEAPWHRKTGRFIGVLVALSGLCVAISKGTASELLSTTNSLITQPLSRAEAIIDEFDLREYARIAAGKLSGGWARRLQLAAALTHAPRLILLDEPTAGLDSVCRQDVWRRMGRLAAGGAGIVVGTHDLAEAERCAHVALLSEGRIVAAGTPEQVAQSAPAVAFLLFGLDARLLARDVEKVPGVLASYPQGASLRIVAEVDIEERLHRMATLHDAGLARVAMRLEDAALVHSRRSSEGDA